MSPAPPRALAFFDVDETLITLKSMFAFYDYFLAAVGHSEAEQDRLRDQAQALLTPGLPRKEGNRLFYRRFAGYATEEVAEHGQAWFEKRMAAGGLFHGDVLAALRRHRADGLNTVLVSGSFTACLDPIAEYAGADAVLCTRLEEREGVYTGGVLHSMIGDGKAEAARSLIAELGVPSADCHAYGDHTSDLDLLRLVGHPVVVGDQAEMRAEAAAHGWPVLEGVPAS
ncbi:HAD family hydrolase [Nocardiopsis trehalosi]|jgi:HAD superfamily hydrolase (TIGR01490 family)|uniref:HAD family hydrolase n=1 Tax=Nocardiopsis trehalosi TaxID=109329 RepID=UPI000836339A|nr:HAD family hydrolase [Nocardiopsis trehalosi]